MFIDESSIEVAAGNGGNGAVAFHREKYVPRGGPSGGNGGRGGHVILQASKDTHTLYDIGNRRIFKAKHGDPGGSANCTGASGADVVVKVPVGTLIKDLETGDLLMDLKEDGQSFVAAEGGRGGAGNATFRSATNQAPRKALPGHPGQKRRLRLELKLVADCGFVGFPNAGKSSLIRKLSAATPKVADYPFTTLKPVLGLVEVATGHSFVLVDIPGLIEGAAEGKGLGHQFLRHVERCACLAFVIDLGAAKTQAAAAADRAEAGDEETGAAGDAAAHNVSDPYSQYVTLKAELEKFHPLLLSKPKMILLHKADLGEFTIDERFAAEKCPVLSTSAVTGLGLEGFKREVWKLIGERGLRSEKW